jgi:hypothetical protein
MGKADLERIERPADGALAEMGSTGTKSEQYNYSRNVRATWLRGGERYYVKFPGDETVYTYDDNDFEPATRN